MLFFKSRAALALAFVVAAIGVSAQDDGVSLRAGLDLALQYKYRSSEVLAEQGEYKDGIDFQRDYLSSPPLASGFLDIGGPTGLSAGFGAEARRQWDDYDSCFSDTNLPDLGRSRNPVALEKGLITRAALYWKSPAIDVALGRDKVDYGKELEGTIYPSSRLPFFDAFRTQGMLGPFTLDWMIAGLESAEAFDDKDVDPNWTTSSDSGNRLNGPYYTLQDKAYGFEDGVNPTTILECFHRFSWNFGAFRVGAAENCIIARRDNHITVQDLLPLLSYHQAGEIPNNNTLYLDASWDVTPEILVSGELGFDDINANVFGVGDSDVPTIPAYVVGGRYTPEPGSGGHFDAYAEAGYTHYLWGNFSADGQRSVTDVDPLARAIYRLRLNGGAVLLPLTSPYGPGARWVRIEGGYRFSETGPRFGAELLVMGKNSEANLVSTPYDTSAKDAPEVFFGSLTFPLSWQFGPLGLSVAPAALVRNQAWWMEATFALSYRYRAETTLKARAQ